MWFEDITLENKTVLGSYTFTEDNIIAFAKIYSPQPFHIDPDSARNFPYGGIIASGWHTAAVWMKLMVAHHGRRIAEGEVDTQDNYISPGFRDLRWHRPVRPGTTLTYTYKPVAKVDWPSRPSLGLLRSHNEARDAAEVLYFSFTQQVLIARRAALPPV